MDNDVQTSFTVDDRCAATEELCHSIWLYSGDEFLYTLYQSMNFTLEEVYFWEKTRFTSVFISLIIVF